MFLMSLGLLTTANPSTISRSQTPGVRRAETDLAFAIDGKKPCGHIFLITFCFTLHRRRFASEVNPRSEDAMLNWFTRWLAPR